MGGQNQIIKLLQTRKNFKKFTIYSYNPTIIIYIIDIGLI